MSETVELNGIQYKMNRDADVIILQRYNEKHKMWVNLRFPTDTYEEGKVIEDRLIDILSNQYINRTAKTQVMDATSSCYHPKIEQ